MDKNELLKNALNKDGDHDSGLSNPLQQSMGGFDIRNAKEGTKSALGSQQHIQFTKNTLTDPKGKNKQVLKSLNKSKRH